jgi:hypothetical protein
MPSCPTRSRALWEIWSRSSTRMTVLMEEIEESQYRLEDKSNEHHPPTCDRILPDKGWLGAL